MTMTRVGLGRAGASRQARVRALMSETAPAERHCVGRTCCSPCKIDRSSRRSAVGIQKGNCRHPIIEQGTALAQRRQAFIDYQYSFIDFREGRT
jgi:hypothetical protein